MLKRYVHGIGSDDPLVSYDGSATTCPIYLPADERGSIMAETNSSGLVTTKHQYGPYGEPMNQSASRFRYTGQILLPGTELYHYKARVYHPKLGRFLQTDPIGYKDGMNWYAYVGNDPMNAVDPNGQFANFAIGAVIGAMTERGTQLATDGNVSSWTKVAISAGVGAVSGGFNVVSKGTGVVQAVMTKAVNESINATAAATGSVIADGLEGNVFGSFERAGVAALESVAGPGKAAVAAVKGKIGGIAEAVGMKTPSANTGIKALDSVVNKGGAAILKITEDVAGNKINNEVKESTK